MVKPTLWMRSITAPDMMDAGVQANKVNAPKKTPEAWSVMFGPIKVADSPQPNAIAFTYSPPEISIAPIERLNPLGKPNKSTS